MLPINAFFLSIIVVKLSGIRRTETHCSLSKLIVVLSPAVDPSSRDEPAVKGGGGSSVPCVFSLAVVHRFVLNCRPKLSHDNDDRMWDCDLAVNQWDLCM